MTVSAEAVRELASGTSPIEHRPLAEAVADYIRELVLTGVLRPGDRVPTEALVRVLGVSRLPVREAFKELTRDGLIDMRPYRGAYVGPIDEQFLREHFEFVGMVHASAAVRVLRQDDDSLIQHLTELAAVVEKASSAGEVASLVREFFSTLEKAGGSPAQRAVRKALGRLLPTGYLASVPGAEECGRRGLKRILDALHSREPAGVRRACIALHREQCQLLVAHLQANNVITD